MAWWTSLRKASSIQQHTRCQALSEAADEKDSGREKTAREGEILLGVSFLRRGSVLLLWIVGGSLSVVMGVFRIQGFEAPPPLSFLLGGCKEAFQAVDGVQDGHRSCTQHTTTRGTAKLTEREGARDRFPRKNPTTLQNCVFFSFSPSRLYVPNLLRITCLLRGSAVAMKKKNGQNAFVLCSSDVIDVSLFYHCAYSFFRYRDLADSRAIGRERHRHDLLRFFPLLLHGTRSQVWVGPQRTSMVHAGVEPTLVRVEPAVGAFPLSVPKDPSVTGVGLFSSMLGP